MNFDKDMTLDEFIQANPDIVVKKRGRWGTYHYQLKAWKDSYQHPHACAGDDKREVYEIAYIYLMKGEK